jgi:hypothetical protein
VATRLSIIWVSLFGLLQSTDVLTTEFDRARGAVESMPISEALLAQGTSVYVGTKLALVLAVSVATLLSLRWLRARGSWSQAIHSYVLSAIRIATVAIAVVSLNNALLLRTLG